MEQIDKNLIFEGTSPESLSKGLENFLKNPGKIEVKDTDQSERINMNIEMSIDLHGYTLIEANKKIESIVNKSYLEGVNKLIVITGKGIHSKNESDPFVSKDLSILKYSVPEFISNNKNLMNIINDIQDAKIEDGGSGAFYIYLKKK